MSVDPVVIQIYQTIAALELRLTRLAEEREHVESCLHGLHSFLSNQDSDAGPAVPPPAGLVSVPSPPDLAPSPPQDGPVRREFRTNDQLRDEILARHEQGETPKQITTAMAPFGVSYQKVSNVIFRHRQRLGRDMARVQAKDAGETPPTRVLADRLRDTKPVEKHPTTGQAAGIGMERRPFDADRARQVAYGEGFA